MYIYVCMYVCMYVCVYVCMYVYSQRLYIGLVLVESIVRISMISYLVQQDDTDLDGTN